jgi:DNA-binding PadR family transcriptional regulator
MPPAAQLNTNALAVLNLLYHDMHRQHYGLSIGKALKMGNGTLYPIVDKLENWGLIKAEKEVDLGGQGRRPRWYYSITAEGITRYEEARAQLFTRCENCFTFFVFAVWDAVFSSGFFRCFLIDLFSR